MTLPLHQALSHIFSPNRPASTIGELEILGAVSSPKAWYRLHLINNFVEPAKEVDSLLQNDCDKSSILAGKCHSARWEMVGTLREVRE
jgi:hypothetical protein